MKRLRVQAVRVYVSAGGDSRAQWDAERHVVLAALSVSIPVRPGGLTWALDWKLSNERCVSHRQKRK